MHRMLRIDYRRQRESSRGRAEERLQRRAAANASRRLVDSGHRNPERGVGLVVHEPKSIPGAGRGPAACEPPDAHVEQQPAGPKRNVSTSAGTTSRCGMPRRCASRTSHPPMNRSNAQVVGPPGQQHPADCRTASCTPASDENPPSLPGSVAATSTDVDDARAATASPRARTVAVQRSRGQEDQRQPRHHGRSGSASKRAVRRSYGHPIRCRRDATARGSRRSSRDDQRDHAPRSPTASRSVAASGRDDALSTQRLPEQQEKQRRVARRRSQAAP